MKRGGGRRLYRPSDVELLRGIRDLLQNAGYTIKGVQKLLREQGVEHVKLAGNGSPGGGVRSNQRRPAFLGVVGEGCVQLSVPEVEALRSIMAELAACRALLEAATRGESRVR
jgi:DNA-binding transcriptional MerR regulator